MHWTESFGALASPAKLGIALVAALFVAFASMVPGDAPAQGVQLLIVVAALIALVVWSLALCRPQSGVRVGWQDLLVLSLLAWIGLSAWQLANQGSPRLTLNLWWTWVGLFAIYWLARQWLVRPLARRTVVAVMLALAVAESVFGLYQSFYSRPRDRQLFRENPERVLRESGIVAPEGSPLRAQFASRMNDTEPLGTFSLTNSLAGFLAPWLILGLAAALAARSARQDSAPRSVVAPPPLPDARSALAGTATVATIGLCLLLTKSRSAYVATACGLVLLALIAGRRRWRVSPWWVAVAGALLLATVAAAAALGYLDREVLTEARKSLGYRWEYWQATLALLRDHPLLGCGPGNFQTYYASYKLPQSSEMIADPHNLLFEAAATAGWPAAILLAALGGVSVIRSLWPALRANVVPPIAAEPSSDEGCRPSDEDSRIWGYLGAAGGLLLGAAASLIGGFVPEPFLYLVALPVGAAVLWALDPWVRFGELPSWTLGTSLAVLFVNLLVAGGLTFPGVAGTLWLLVAGSVDRTSPEAPDQGRGFRGLGPLAVLACGGLLVGCLATAYRPVLLAHIALERGDRLVQLGEAGRAETAYQNAADQDPWSHEPWIRLAALYEAGLSRGASANEAAWRSLDAAATEACSRNRHSYLLHSELGDLYLAAWRRTGRQQALSRAAEFYDAALALYPACNILHAQRAWVWHLAGQPEAARQAARRALELDDQNPHLEQKLENQRIFDVSPGLPTQPAPPVAQDAYRVANELISGT